MAKRISRGKQQILFHNLPGQTFDFGRTNVIALVEAVRGRERDDIAEESVLASIQDDARAWDARLRPALRDDVLRDPRKFTFVEPRSVSSSMFPLVFWCQNAECGHVVVRSSGSLPASGQCPLCHRGRLKQMGLVRIHRCGALLPLAPSQCPQCHSPRWMALDRRGSERVSSFRWVCRRCNTPVNWLGSRCPQCTWDDPDLRWTDIESHRAGRTFYPRYVVLLNQPGPEMKALLSTPGWWAAVAAKYLDLPQMQNVTLAEWRQRAAHAAAAEDDPGIGRAELESLMGRLTARQISPEAMAAEMESVRQQRQAQRGGATVETLAAAIESSTGVARSAWEGASHELLEAISPRLSGATKSLAMDSEAGVLARSMGIEDVSVVTDFPITTAVYGFSRSDYQPAACRLNAFPPDRDSGRLPVFTDVVEADAIMVRLYPLRVCRWLAAVGHAPRLPAGASAEMATRAYFVSLFGDVSLRATLDSQTPQARLAFGLLHTLSHVCVRQAALLCGLDRNSLSEYVLPRALTFAIYCNHRFGATIGALVSLFEQAINEWLRGVAGSRHCVYDPVCRDRGGTCHSCTHLAETSCRFFNLNLGRHFLHGGIDPELGEVSGYLDRALDEA